MVIHSSGSQISKQEIRAYVLQKRRTLLPEEKQRWDEALLERLHPLFPSAGTAVYAYTSVRGEASTEYLIDELLRRGCPGSAPAGCLGVRCVFSMSQIGASLWRGHMASRNRRTDVRRQMRPKALVITPGVGFSKDGNRIGYGAGYYDRFFAAEPDHMAVGLCYGFQLFPAFETEKHDKKMAYIVTPEQTIKVL